MRYHQITREERYTLATLRRQGYSQAEMARLLNRHPSTISRELRRNRTTHDGHYRAEKAQEHANARRWTPRRNSRFSEADWALVDSWLRQKFSPEQTAGWLRRFGLLSISHEWIYQHVWGDKHRGGDLWRHVRQPLKRRKRYNTYERRGHVPGKRHISERPAIVETRSEVGHWEMDTIIGTSDQHCLLSLVERVTGATLLGKLTRRNMTVLNARLIELITAHPGLFKTITADNGSEFHGFAEVERTTGVPIYFANPYHSWERGTNENTNGLVRQYVPKRTSMKHLTQQDCNRIASALNNRPRKRHDYHTPLEMLSEFFTIV